MLCDFGFFWIFLFCFLEFLVINDFLRFFFLIFLLIFLKS